MWVNLDFFSIYYERQSVKTRKKRDFEQLLQPVKEKHFVTNEEKLLYLRSNALYTKLLTTSI